MLTVILRMLMVFIRRRFISFSCSWSSPLRHLISQLHAMSSQSTVAIRASGPDVTTVHAARRRPTVAGRDASARRAATISATLSAPRPSAAPMDTTIPACVSCVEPHAAIWRTSKRNTTENVVRITLVLGSHINLAWNCHSEHSFSAVKHAETPEQISTSFATLFLNSHQA